MPASDIQVMVRIKYSDNGLRVLLLSVLNIKKIINNFINKSVILCVELKQKLSYNNERSVFNNRVYI